MKMGQKTGLRAYMLRSAEGCQTAPCQGQARGLGEALLHSQESKPVPAAPSSWASDLQSCEMIHFCNSSHSACGTLVRQPLQTNIHNNDKTGVCKILKNHTNIKNNKKFQDDH